MYIYIYIHVYVYVCAMVGIRGHHLRDNSSRLSPQTRIDVYIGIQNEKGGGTRSAGSELLGGNSRGGTGRVVTGLPGS